jgi:hypothetical protein
MSEVIKIVMDKNELQPLANSIKTLNGTLETITLTGMENTLSKANEEIDTQSILIEQALNALNNKVGIINTCEVSYSGINGSIIYSNGAAIMESLEENATLQVAKNSLLYINKTSSSAELSIVGEAN